MVLRSLLLTALTLGASGIASLGLDASAQSAACPIRRAGTQAPVELGIAAGESGDFVSAARYFEQHKTCVDQNRPSVRDGLNGLAAFRVAGAYLQARDMPNLARVTGEALAWHPNYVAGLPPGDERSDQFSMLIYFHGARAISLMGDRPIDAQALLNRARALLMQYPQEQPESAFMVLAMLATLIEDDYAQYAPVQRDLLQRLRREGASYRAELRSELLNYARVSRTHSNFEAAQNAESEARGLR